VSAKLELRGFDELKAYFAQFATKLQQDADPILLRAARQSEAQLLEAYPVVTGALRAGVKIVERRTRRGVTFYRLVSSAYHAHLYEFGTKRQPPRATFLPITERDRRAATVAIANLVRAEGLAVTGDKV
jgi:HK97 gp10 family phage protein